MTGDKDSKFIETLAAHEGKEPYAYQDSRGYWTIGIGRCIDKRINNPLTEEEMLMLLNNDIERCRSGLSRCAFYRKCTNAVRQDVLVELCFNMGLSNLLRFTKMISAIDNADFELAAQELAYSKWALEVSKEKVDNIKYRLENGVYP